MQSTLATVAASSPSDRRIKSLGISTPDGPWALVAHTPGVGWYRTFQGGPRRLWDLLETAHRQWTALNEPGWERFGLTVTPGRHWIWLDSPDGEHRWPTA